MKDLKVGDYTTGDDWCWDFPIGTVVKKVPPSDPGDSFRWQIVEVPHGEFEVGQTIPGSKVEHLPAGAIVKSRNTGNGWILRRERGAFCTIAFWPFDNDKVPVDSLSDRYEILSLP